jgi:hypothetical protein
MDTVLIHPPLSRPCEAPAGVALLAGALKAHGIPHLSVDANLEGVLHLLQGEVLAEDTFTRRAKAHLEENLAFLRNGNGFRDRGQYIRAVSEISHILEVRALPQKTRLGLNNLQHDELSPLRSADLVRRAEEPEGDVFAPYLRTRLTGLLEAEAPRTVGISINFLSQALGAFAAIGLLRSLDAGMRIVLGGGLITSWLKGPLEGNPFTGLVDDMVAGPGENRLLELAGVRSPHSPRVPDYDAFRGLPYLSPGFVLPFAASTGCCWGRCSFCPERAERNRYACIPAREVPPRVNDLCGRYAPSLVHFTDNAMSPALLSAMAASGLDAPWYGFARFTPQLTDPDFCRALRHSGCVMLQLGLESGDQAVLDSLDKGIELEDASRALRNLHAAGIGTYVYLLFGTPAEDEESARTTLDFVAAHAAHIDFLNLSVFNLPRYGDEAGSLETYDFSEGDLSLYQGFTHPRGWDRSRVRRFLDREFRRHPAIAGIVRNDPPFFTSNHAPFFS